MNIPCEIIQLEPIEKHLNLMQAKFPFNKVKQRKVKMVQL